MHRPKKLTTTQAIDGTTSVDRNMRQYPELNVDGNGLVSFRGRIPLVGANAGTDKGYVHLGGQAPMFSPEIVADDGLVRLGGQSPIF